MRQKETMASEQLPEGGGAVRLATTPDRSTGAKSIKQRNSLLSPSTLLNVFLRRLFGIN